MPETLFDTVTVFETELKLSFPLKSKLILEILLNSNIFNFGTEKFEKYENHRNCYLPDVVRNFPLESANVKTRYFRI